MSDTPAQNDAPAPAETAPADTAPAAAPAWDGEFDQERAARLIANLREENKGYKSQLGEVQAKLTTFEQAQMSETEKLAQRAETAERELAQARRDMSVSAALRKHGLSDDMAEFLTGETADEIDTRAAKLAGAIPAKPAAASPLPSTLPIPGTGADPLSVAQLTEADLNSMSPQEIVRARLEGRLDALFNRS